MSIYEHILVYMCIYGAKVNDFRGENMLLRVDVYEIEEENRTEMENKLKNVLKSLIKMYVNGGEKDVSPLFYAATFNNYFRVVFHNDMELLTYFIGKSIPWRNISVKFVHNIERSDLNTVTAYLETGTRKIFFG